MRKNLDVCEEYTRSSYYVAYIIVFDLSGVISVDDYKYKLGTNAYSNQITYGVFCANSYLAIKLKISLVG